MVLVHHLLSVEDEKACINTILLHLKEDILFLLLGLRNSIMKRLFTF